MSIPKQQNFMLEFPKPHSLKPSFQSIGMGSTNINTVQNSSMDNFELYFIENQDKNKISPILQLPNVKRLSLQTKPLKSVIVPAKTKISKRNSWCLMRNVVKGLSFLRTPQIFSIKDEVNFVLFVYILAFL